MADCDWVVLCDYAFPDHRGKLCLIGIFDVIYAPNVPAVHERAAVAFSVFGEPGERVELKLEIISPQGQVITKSPAQVFTLPDAGSAQGRIELRGLPLNDFGRYAMQIDLGPASTKATWFTLQQKTSP